MNRKSAGILLIFIFFPVLLEAETYYVKSIKAVLKEKPAFSSMNLTVLKQGESMELMEKKGSWGHVKYGEQEGWVSVFLISKQAPLKMKTATLLEKSKVNLAGKSRRRASTFTTAAAARGLSEERARQGRERYVSNFSDLEKVESYLVTEENIAEFLKEGGLK